MRTTRGSNQEDGQHLCSLLDAMLGRYALSPGNGGNEGGGRGGGGGIGGGGGVGGGGENGGGKPQSVGRPDHDLATSIDVTSMATKCMVVGLQTFHGNAITPIDVTLRMSTDVSAVAP